MKKLNHLMTYESFVKEEFNPFQVGDWKQAGNTIRKGVGFLNPQEQIEKGKQLVVSHPTRNRIYQQFLRENPDKAQKYLIFWAKNPDINATPVWNEKTQSFIDRASYSYGSGPGGRTW